MGLKRSLSIATLALALLGLAAPAASSAHTIKDHGQTLENVHISMGGPLVASTSLGAMECTLDVTMTVNIDTVTISEIHITTETCKGTGFFAACEVTGDKVEWPAGPLTVNAEDLEMETGTVTMTLAHCLANTLTVTPTAGRIALHRINWKYETKPIYVGWEFGYPGVVDAASQGFEAKIEAHLMEIGVEEGTYEIV